MRFGMLAVLLGALIFPQAGWVDPTGLVYAQSESGSQNVDLTTAFEGVASKVGPTVVAIRTERIERYRPGRFFGSPFEDDFFNRFFQDFFGDQFDQEYRSAGLGSGVIIDPKGYILTNEHVIREADKIMVRLADGREAQGKVVGTDPRSDLTIVKIDLKNLPVAKLGDSEKLKIGQWVVAVGNPFGHLLPNPEPTITTGVISALKRSLPRTSRRDIDYTDLIQTDAAINPGNSGGPLVNLQGEVVGINVAIFSTSGGYQGIGFAIPVSHAKRILSQLMAGKPVVYGWIGVGVQNLDQRLADYFGLKSPEGVLVTSVWEASPAQKAEIKNGDIILSINGQKVKNTALLTDMIGSAPIGKKVTIEILRQGKTLSIPVVVEKRPGFDERGRVMTSKEKESPLEEQEVKAWRGLSVQDIPAGRLPPDSSDDSFDKTGVGIVGLEMNSPADLSGLREGDAIVSINQQPIRNTEDFYRVTRNLKGDCLIQTRRGYFVIKEQ